MSQLLVGSNRIKEDASGHRFVLKSSCSLCGEHMLASKHVVRFPRAIELCEHVQVLTPVRPPADAATPQHLLRTGRCCPVLPVSRSAHAAVVSPSRAGPRSGIAARRGARPIRRAHWRGGTSARLIWPALC
eukprot:5841524-Prymnesium_polylepis.1